MSDFIILLVIFGAGTVKFAACKKLLECMYSTILAPDTWLLVLVRRPKGTEYRDADLKCSLFYLERSANEILASQGQQALRLASHWHLILV